MKARQTDRGKFLVLGGPTLLVLWFLQSYAYRYFTLDVAQLGIYGPRREWLYAHMFGGTVALLLGPVQLWLGLNRRSILLHRVLGVGYVMGVVLGGTAAFSLAFHTDFGWVFGMGLVAMSVAWILSTTFGVAAVCRCLIEQHHEWMIRSYVITFSFVTFRILTSIFDVVGVGTTVERLTAAAWASWSVPLLITEVVLQGRKIFASGVGRAKVPSPALTVSPVYDRAPLLESTKDVQS